MAVPIITRLCPLMVVLLMIDVSLSFNTVDRSRKFYEAETEFTIHIPPGTSECFYQNAQKGYSLEIEYQVIDSSFGEVEIQQDLDVNFHLYSPGGKQELISDYKRSNAMHKYDAKESGDYKFCFDNEFSHFSKKTVYFEVYVDNNDENDEDPFWEEYSFSPELLYNDTMDQIKRSIEVVHDKLKAVKHHQDQLKAIESRDRNVQEHNYSRVNQFSMLFIISMLVVGILQVLIVRSLFEERSKIRKIFQMIGAEHS